MLLPLRGGCVVARSVVGTLLLQADLWVHDLEILEGKVHHNGRWVWKTTLAGEYSGNLDRKVAAAFARACPTDGWRGVDERECLGFWTQQLSESTGRSVDPPRRPVVPSWRTSPWENDTRFSIESGSRLARLAAIKEKLNIQCNVFTDEAAASLANMIMEGAHLKWLDLGINNGT